MNRNMQSTTRVNIRRLPVSTTGAVLLPQAALPGYIEYGFYFALAYDTLGSMLPVQIPMLGGVSWLMLAAICLKITPLSTKTLCASILLPLGCFISYSLVQLIVHKEGLGVVRPFINWMLIVIITHSLCLRPGFLHRFAVVVFAIGLVALPNLVLDPHDAHVERGRIEDTLALGDQNALGEWFGFSVVYFITSGLEAPREKLRAAYWFMALVSLSVVGLTVSRGALLAVAIATVVALRRLLNRGFVPLLLFVVVCTGAYASGLFERAIFSYAARGMEETGRLLVWPLAIQSFVSSPLFGVGASNIAIPVFSASREGVITPHNGFLTMALSAGIFPVVFFIAYWWRGVKGIMRLLIQRSIQAPLLLPLFIYSFVVIQFGNGTFMRPFVVATLAVALTASLTSRIHRVVIHRAKAATNPAIRTAQ